MSGEPEVRLTFRLTWDPPEPLSVLVRQLLKVRFIDLTCRDIGEVSRPCEILALGEQPLLGQYDIANRNRDRVTGIVIITPVSALSFNASAGRLKDEYPASSFGLRNGDNNVYTVGFDAVPVEKVNFGLSYGYERNNALQASRYAGHSSTTPSFC